MMVVILGLNRMKIVRESRNVHSGRIRICARARRPASRWPENGSGI